MTAVHCRRCGHPAEEHDRHGAYCPVCGGDEDPCPVCTAWAELTPELLEDLRWVADHGQWHTRPALPIDGERELGTSIGGLGLIDRWPDGGWRLTDLGIDVVRAIMRAR